MDDRLEKSLLDFGSDQEDIVYIFIFKIYIIIFIVSPVVI